VPEKALFETAVENIIWSNILEDFHTCMPGRVESYDFKTQKATVKPLIKKVYNDGDILIVPVLPNVPVIFPRTTKSGITFPVNTGDKVLLLFTERALENWYLTGEDSTPGDKRKYSLSDSVCIPGLFSFNENNLASNNDDLEIHHNGFKITITKDGKISIKGKDDLDLLAIIDEWMSQMKTTKVITGIGLQPFDPTSITAMTVIQTKLQELLT